MAWNRFIKAAAPVLAASSFSIVLAVLPDVMDEYQHVLMLVGIAGMVFGAVLFLIGNSRPEKTKDEVLVPGDTYNNSGANFGHMGPVNIGHQRFEFTQEVAAEVLRAVPREGELHVRIIGNTPHAQRVGNHALKILKRYGYRIGGTITIGYMSNAPQQPITYDHRARQLTIVPDV